MRRLVRLFSTSIGRKIVVAASGIALIGFLVVHMLGNMAVFQGPEALNSYSAWLQGHPFLWVARAGLVAVFSIHIYLALQLALSNRSARPAGYGRHEVVAATISSRRIAMTGLLILAFLVYHILHFTLGVVQPEYAHLADVGSRHDVYSMMVYGFQSRPVAASYIVAMVILGFHLRHAAASLFQTLGVNHESYNGLIHAVAIALAAIIVIGNCSIPILVQAGVITPAGGA